MSTIGVKRFILEGHVCVRVRLGVVRLSPDQRDEQGRRTCSSDGGYQQATFREDRSECRFCSTPLVTRAYANVGTNESMLSAVPHEV